MSAILRRLGRSSSLFCSKLFVGKDQVFPINALPSIIPDGLNDRVAFWNNSSLDHSQALAMHVAGSGMDRFPGGLTIENTSAETTLFQSTSFSGVLSTSLVIYFFAYGNYLNNSGASRTLTLRVKYGATTILDGDIATITASATRRSWRMYGFLSALNATNAQRAYVDFHLSNATALTAGFGGTYSSFNLLAEGGASEDSTSSLQLTVTVQHSFAHADLEIIRNYARIRMI